MKTSQAELKHNPFFPFNPSLLVFTLLSMDPICILPSDPACVDQPSRCDSVSSLPIITDIKIDSLSLLVSLLSVKSTLGTKSQ